MHAHVEDMHRAIERLGIGPDQNLWVLDAEGAWRPPQGTDVAYDVFNHAGVYVERIALAGVGARFADDELWIAGDYVVVVHGSRAALKSSMGTPSVESDEQSNSIVSCYLLR